MSSPNNRDLLTKNKITRHLVTGGGSGSVYTGGGSVGMLPRNIITRKQHGLKEENRELRGKVERKKQPVRWFVQEMDQLLAEH